MELVSVIIPVFNSVCSLEISVKSVKAQTYTNLEIILIDDGSTDGSSDLCNKLMEEDIRIKVIHQANQGVSAARNAGLKIATGSFVCFLDSDDTYEPNAIYFLLMGIKENDSQMCVCTYFENNSNQPIHTLDPGKYSYENYIKAMVINPTHFFFGVLWNKIFYRSIIVENVIEFRLGMNMGEDFIFVCEYLSKIENIYAVDIPLYIYMTTQSQLTKIEYDISSKWIMTKEMYKSYILLFNEKKNTKKYIKKGCTYLIDIAKFLCEKCSKNRKMFRCIVVDEELQQAVRIYSGTNVYSLVFCYMIKLHLYLPLYELIKMITWIKHVKN